MAPIATSESITASAGLIGMASAGELLGQPHDNGKPWYTTMHRCGQVNFDETDPLTMGADA